MPSKRKHGDTDLGEVVHPSRQAQVPGALPKPAKKPRRFEPPTYKKQQHASSVNAIKKRIRDVSRKLERSEDLPANIRIEDERALAAFRQELEEAEGQKLRNKMIKKYHMVRFFGRISVHVSHIRAKPSIERQKATRQLKKLRKRILEAESTDEVERLKEQLHIAEVDLTYTQYHPLCETYVSLYPPKSSEDEEDEETIGAVAKPKPVMWAEVEKCMETGMLNKLKNRMPSIKANTSKPLEKKKKTQSKIPLPKPAPAIDTTGLNRRERRKKERGAYEGKQKNKSLGFEKNKAFGAEQAAKSYTNNADDDDDSDGGFFEE